MPDKEKIIWDLVHLVEIAKDALALLKEQDAVKPIFDEVDVCGRCGNCGHALTQQKMIGDDVLMDEMFDYCPSCGRKVKWNETD